MTNETDAIPTMAYAISAYRKSGGDKGSDAYKSYSEAISAIARNYGSDTATEMQNVVNNVAVNNGDLNTSLKRYAKDTLSRKGATANKFIRNFLAVADQNENILSKFTYGFNLPDGNGGADKIAAIQKVIQRN